MRWKIKALIQNAIAILPSNYSYSLYYWIQRNLGNLKTIDTKRILTGGADACNKLKTIGCKLHGKTVFEVGTGRAPIVPIALWLAGAHRVITVDLNPYLKQELFNESLDYIKNNREEVEAIFGPILISERLDQLIEYSDCKLRLDELLEFFNIDYKSPVDAANLDIDVNSIDIHLSYTVYEHIPPNIIKDILLEGNRILKEDGVFINAIDYFDHFWTSDKSISPINFLKYSDKQWDKYAGNRYMYMNRLRHDDFMELFKEVNHEIVLEEVEKDYNVYQLLQHGNLILDDAFTDKTKDVLSIISSWIISRKRK